MLNFEAMAPVTEVPPMEVPPMIVAGIDSARRLFGDPLADIGVMEKVAFVLKGGEVVKNDQ